MAVFIDSSVFVGYASKKDVHHKKAVKIITEIVSGTYGKAYTTDYVFDESVSVALRRSRDLQIAVELGNYIFRSEVFLLKLHSSLIEKSCGVFKKNNFGLSFTDCTNISFMENFGIKNIATFDKGFEKVKSINVIS